MDIKRMSLTLFVLFLLMYFGLYFNKPPFLVKTEIQDFLDRNYEKSFVVTDIDRTYSPDFLHEVIGYRIRIKDSKGVEVSNIFIQKRNGNWKLFKGSNIESQYDSAKSNPATQ